MTSARSDSVTGLRLDSVIGGLSLETRVTTGKRTGWRGHGGSDKDVSSITRKMLYSVSSGKTSNGKLLEDSSTRTYSRVRRNIESSLVSRTVSHSQIIIGKQVTDLRIL